MAKPQKFIDLCARNIGNVNQFIHDGSTTQKKFMRQFSVPNYDARREGDGKYDTILVDSLHSNIKRYLFKHAGYRLKNLQHYMNFFVYRYNHTPKSKISNNRQIIKSRNNMVEDLFYRVKRINKKITYRNFQSDLGITEILKSVDNNYYYNKVIN
jgi:hypothetical protein